MTREDLLKSFIQESNQIENIHRDADPTEVSMMKSFIIMDAVTIGDLINAVNIFQKASDLGHAALRSKHGQDVRVGQHHPPRGGEFVVSELQHILTLANSNEETPFQVHVRYETLHPFMDGNGRSGRLLWAWQMFQKYQWQALQLGFLHSFYYQTLRESR